jgi:hypothetical protein
MEALIIQAYYKARSNHFLAITTMVERLLRKRYSWSDERTWLTTGEVRRVLERKGLLIEYSISGI